MALPEDGSCFCHLGLRRVAAVREDRGLRPQQFPLGCQCDDSQHPHDPSRPTPTPPRRRLRHHPSQKAGASAFRAGIARPGARTTALHRVTTLPQATRYCKAAVADRHRRRGQVGVPVRALKDDLALGVRRCQTPAMVRKEIALSAVAFHAVRAVMVGGRGGEPRTGAAEFHGGERGARVVYGAVVGPRGSCRGIHRRRIRVR